MIHCISFALYLSCCCDCDLDFSVSEESATKYFVVVLFLPVVFCHASESVCVLEFMGTPSGCHKIENCRCELKLYCCSLLLYVGSNMLVIVYIFLTFQPLFILTTAVCLCQYISYLHWQCGMLDHCDSIWYNVKWHEITSKRCFCGFFVWCT
jgi:hypothetical protein